MLDEVIFFLFFRYDVLYDTLRVNVTAAELLNPLKAVNRPVSLEMGVINFLCIGASCVSSHFEVCRVYGRGISH